MLVEEGRKGKGGGVDFFFFEALVGEVFTATGHFGAFEGLFVCC